jgi:hypothetical protein
MQAQTPYASFTQTIQQPSGNPTLTLRFPSNARAPAAGLLPQANIPKKINDLIQLIIKTDLFTLEQKTLASHWEGHVIQLLSHKDVLLPAKAVCFLGIKVITPALVRHADNRLAKEQLIPFVRAQRELLSLLLPNNSIV